MHDLRQLAADAEAVIAAQFHYKRDDETRPEERLAAFAREVVNFNLPSSEMEVQTKLLQLEIQVRLLRLASKPFVNLDRELGDEWLKNCDYLRMALDLTVPKGEKP